MMKSNLFFGGSDKPTKAERVGKILKESTLKLYPTFNSLGWLQSLVIELDGLLARVPSLKNSKLPGRNFMAPHCSDYLRALDTAYTKAVIEGAFDAEVTFLSEPLFMFVMHGRRPQYFDEDNATSTLKDWLEVTTKQVGKKVRDRGWGAGITENDRLVTAWPIRATDLGMSITKTTMYITLLSDAREMMAEVTAHVSTNSFCKCTAPAQNVFRFSKREQCI